MLNRILALIALAALSTPAAATAQADLQTGLVDRVVAIVGDSAVLQLEIQVRAERMALSDSTLPGPGHPDFEAFLRDVLETRVDELMVIQAAERDTLIQVDEATIDQQISDYIDGLARQFGGQPALQAALRDQMGMSLAEFREMQRTELRQGQIVQMYMARQAQGARPAEVTEDELRAEFERLRPQLQQRPAQLTFRQVVVRPQASDSAKAAALAEAEALFERLRAGEDFAELAREHSDDLGSASLGGDVGWFRRGSGFFREFEDAAFSLPAGGMGVVETPAGWHIIKVERTRSRSEVQARHILKMPEVTSADVERARDTARRVFERARAGEDMGELFVEFGEESQPDSITVEVPRINELPPSYGVLRTATEGEVLGPLQFQGSGRLSDVRFSVVKVARIREAGEWTFEDIRPTLANQLQERKRQERILDDLRANTYIDVRM